MPAGSDQQQHWDATYGTHEEFFGIGPSDFGVRAATVLEEAKVQTLLELGCSQGRNTLLFLQRGVHVTALDYAETAIRQLQARAEAAGLDARLTTHKHDVREPLPFPKATFDACVSHMSFTMALTERELERAFAEVWRVLKPGGLNLYSVRNDHDPHFGKGPCGRGHVAELDGVRGPLFLGGQGATPCQRL
jgi:SAM-dependent methyltransferase